MMKSLLALLVLVTCAFVVPAQESPKADATPDPVKKANSRPALVVSNTPEPYDGASVEKMSAQCVTFETEAGIIEMEMIPEVAPESVRNFLNLSATGAFDTTTFNRVVKGFVIQGGNLATSQKWGFELAKRMSRKLPDEPGLVKHERGIVSMARPEEANSATTSFFILVGDGHHLDGKFSAFGRVKKGMEVADAINQAAIQDEKPEKPVRINRALIKPCAAGK
jgi:peptidyl-prolyl cis-trans isomerase B (cyclophilin B)